MWGLALHEGARIVISQVPSQSLTDKENIQKAIM